MNELYCTVPTKYSIATKISFMNEFCIHKRRDLNMHVRSEQ